jgi:recombination protein RecR
MKLPDSLIKLIEHFQSLPGVGPRSAERLAFFILKEDTQKIQNFIKSISEVKENLRFCSICHNIAEDELCKVCSDPLRNNNKLCVVENILNLVAIEKTGYDGIYHVLGGVLNPIHGVNPENLNIDSLLSRLQNNSYEEIELIMATNPTMEGESTALFIKRRIEQLGLKNIKTTRIGRGIPTGGDLEFADKATIDNALQGRREY